MSIGKGIAIAGICLSATGLGLTLILAIGTTVVIPVIGIFAIAAVTSVTLALFS